MGINFNKEFFIDFFSEKKKTKKP